MQMHISSWGPPASTSKHEVHGPVEFSLLRIVAVIVVVTVIICRI